MKIKAEMIQSLNFALDALASRPLKRELSKKISDFIVKQFDSEFKVFNMEYKAICVKNSKKDENGKPLMKEHGTQYDIKNQEEFDKEIKEYFDTEIEFNFTPIIDEELGAAPLAPAIETILKRTGLVIAKEDSKNPDKPENEVKIN